MREFTNSLSIRGVVEEIQIDKVRPPKFLLRSPQENLYGLQLSIEQNGLLQPIIVRPLGEEFEVVAGNRRLQACRMLKFRKIPCHIVDVEDREALEFSIVENVQRDSLSPLEEAYAFKQYVERYGWGGSSDLAKQIGKSVSYVSRRIKLLSLPPELQEEFLRQRKNSSIISEILTIEDDNLVKEISEFVFKNELSKSDTRKLVKQVKSEFPCYMGNKKSKAAALPFNSNLKFEDEVLNKSVTVLKIALARMGDLINEFGESRDWRFRELMLERRYALHQLIDSFIVIRNKIRRM